MTKTAIVTVLILSGITGLYVMANLTPNHTDKFIVLRDQYDTKLNISQGNSFLVETVQDSLWRKETYLAYDNSFRAQVQKPKFYNTVHDTQANTLSALKDEKAEMLKVKSEFSKIDCNFVEAGNRVKCQDIKKNLEDTEDKYNNYINLVSNY